jgi:hypothetical protein
MSLREMCLSKVAPVSSTGLPSKSRPLHFPHFGPAVSLDEGSLFTLAQAGQTM